MARDSFLKQSLGALHNRIKTCRVLMVGAGGIGCELLKNVVLTGFGEIHIVDLDTIDLSNLNRQFLFRHEHIKKSKARIAKETASKFNPNVKIEAYHANIKDPQFNIEWFQTFNLVFNALDNLEARRHVNRMCLLSNVPLIESGTTGFAGQVQAIKKGVTECYDCNEKEVPKTFPVCTIRSTPSQPIHCIVWAKSYLFTEIFGRGETEASDLDYSEDSGNSEELEKLKEESQALLRLREAMGTSDFPRKVFEKVFDVDIERLRGIEDMWKTRKAPVALKFEELQEKGKAVDAKIAKQDQRAWDISENFVVFCDSVQRLSKQSKQAENGTDTVSRHVLDFDKDDDDSLDFVTAAANLRSIIFDIETKSKFDVKQMAGNIIPAIATTNAMTAGLCVLQAFKILRGQIARAKTVFLERSAARVISSEPPRPPNPNCTVCSQATSKLVMDSSRATIGNLVDDILRLKLGYGEELTIRNESTVLYDPEFDDNITKTFSELDIKTDNFLTVIDEGDESPRVDLSFTVVEKAFPENSGPIEVPEDLSIARKPKPASNSDSGGITNGTANGTSHGPTNGTSNGSQHATSNGNGAVDSGPAGHDKDMKRKRSDAELEVEASQVSKKYRPAKESGEGGAVGGIIIDESQDGAIVIED